MFSKLHARWIHSAPSTLFLTYIFILFSWSSRCSSSFYVSRPKLSPCLSRPSRGLHDLPSNSPRSDHRNFVWWRVVCTSWSSSLCIFLHLPVTSLCALFCSAPLNPYSSLVVTTDQVLHPEEATNKIIRFPVFMTVKTTYTFLSWFWYRVVWWMLIVFQRIILSPVEGTSDWIHTLAYPRSECEHNTVADHF